MCVIGLGLGEMNITFNKKSPVARAFFGIMDLFLSSGCRQIHGDGILYLWSD